MFNILNKFLNLDKNLFNNNSKQMQSNSEFNIYNDIINICHKNERMIRSQIGICSENLMPKREITVSEINLTNHQMSKEVNNFIKNISLYPIELQYNLFVRTIDGINETYIPNTRIWDPNEALELKPSDLIIVRDSYHMFDIKIDQFIEGLKNAIIENGFLLIIFKYRYTEPEISLNSLNTLNKIDLFDDIFLANRIEMFKTLANNSGLILISTKSDSISNKSLLFRKIVEKPKLPENDCIINISPDYNKWFNELKIKVKKCEDISKKYYLIANDSTINGILGLYNCLRLEPGGEHFRCIFQYNNQNSDPIDIKSKLFEDIVSNDLAINVIKDGKLGTYRHLKLSKDYNKVVSNEYYLNEAQPRDLSSLQWFDLKKFRQNEILDNNNNRYNAITINIYSTGISFLRPNLEMTASGM